MIAKARNTKGGWSERADEREQHSELAGAVVSLLRHQLEHGQQQDAQQRQDDVPFLRLRPRAAHVMCMCTRCIGPCELCSGIREEWPARLWSVSMLQHQVERGQQQCGAQQRTDVTDVPGSSMPS